MSTKTVLWDSGQGMMVKLCDVHADNGQGMCLIVMYHSFVDMEKEHRAPGPKPEKENIVLQ